jgi:hypothetical protein
MIDAHNYASSIRQKCGCYKVLDDGFNIEACDFANYHNINCAVMTEALKYHLGSCGWTISFSVCTQWVLHMTKAELMING